MGMFDGVCLDTVSRLLSEDAGSVIRADEERYTHQLEQAVRMLTAPGARYRGVLLAGPSGSAKTTTAHRLAARLGQLRMRAPVVSLDSFFKNPEELPLEPDGSIDYETVYALDLPLLQQCLDRIAAQGEADFPVFNFVERKRSDQWQRVSVTENTVLVLEGLHALNPLTLPPGDSDRFLRLFVSPERPYEHKGTTLLDGRTLRLIRRLVRDFTYRGNPTDDTLKMWEGAVREEASLLELGAAADVRIDTGLSYEPGVYAPYLQSCMEAQSTLSAAARSRLSGLLEQLSFFPPVSPGLIPPESVVWEFIPREVKQL